VLRPQRVHVGGEILPPDARVAALGQWLLQVRLLRRPAAHLGGQLQLQVLLPRAEAIHPDRGQRVAAQGGDHVPAMPRAVRSTVCLPGKAVSSGRGARSAQQIPARQPRLRSGRRDITFRGHNHRCSPAFWPALGSQLDWSGCAGCSFICSICI